MGNKRVLAEFKVFNEDISVIRNLHRGNMFYHVLIKCSDKRKKVLVGCEKKSVPYYIVHEHSDITDGYNFFDEVDFFSSKEAAYIALVNYLADSAETVSKRVAEFGRNSDLLLTLRKIINSEITTLD